MNTFTVIGKTDQGDISVQWIEAISSREALIQAFHEDLWEAPPIEVFALIQGEQNCLLAQAGIQHGYAVGMDDLVTAAVKGGAGR